ncbi:MAG: hypothetical protein JW888_11105 [Pirellulales bacterium]|nr:hypothetical protein [Pirellulales bacterium]
MNVWDDDGLWFAQEESPCSDSLSLDWLLPLNDKEAACIETLCEEAGPSPLVIDDIAAGDGVVVATLPDGRHIISLAPTGSPDDPAWVDANARLICHARSFLIRLLRDRGRWCEERKKLLSRIEALEAAQRSRPTKIRSRADGPMAVRPR